MLCFLLYRSISTPSFMNVIHCSLVNRTPSLATHFLPFFPGSPIWIPRLCCALPLLCNWGWVHRLALAQWVRLQETAWGQITFLLWGVTTITLTVSTFIILVKYRLRVQKSKSNICWIMIHHNHIADIAIISSQIRDHNNLNTTLLR